MHHIKALIDFVKAKSMRDQIVYIDFPVHVPVDNLWHITTPWLRQKPYAPDSTCCQLKRPGGYSGLPPQRQ